MAWAPDYVTVAELKNYLQLTDTVDDVWVQLWITTASRNVDDFTARQFGRIDTPEDRTYTGVWDRHIGATVYQIDDLMDTGGLAVVDADGTAVTDFELEPANATRKRRPVERLITSATRGKLTPTAVWGWDPAADGPKVAQMGLLLQANRLKARRNSPFGVAGSPAEGSEIRLLAQLDPDFRTSLRPFVRDWWAA